MAGRAEDLIRDYWKVCEEGDFTKLTPFFAANAILVDPMYGTFTGRDAIAGFMSQIMSDMAPGIVFVAEEVAGDENTAWARWKFSTSAGEGTGGSIFRIEGGLI
ncbi:MAG TPA: nuclear transport factor 2 family protein, partial [Dehalococcoidia bacterium]|nr:nuclear transport factor 2 family protein [Dehalococcoidia bacterium]